MSLKTLNNAANTTAILTRIVQGSQYGRPMVQNVHHASRSPCCRSQVIRGKREKVLGGALGETRTLQHGVPNCAMAINRKYNKEKSSRLCDTYLVCNHGFQGLSDSAHNMRSVTGSDVNSCNLNAHTSATGDFLSCGKCNILGGKYKHGVDIPFALSTSLDFSDQDDSSTQLLPLSLRATMRNTQYIQNTSPRTFSAYKPFSTYSAHDTNWIVVRSFHSSAKRYLEEPKSKAEETVKALKEEIAEKEKPKTKAEVKIERSTVEEQVIQALKASRPAPKPDPLAITEEPKPKLPLKQRIIHEVKHYYNGFRLLFIDVKVCSRHLWRVLNGKTLTRRERRQVVRTTADLFRLVPFSVFIIVPFFEFLLPVALALFPGMLPSTFAEESKEKAKYRKKLKVKLEMAKFLQDTVEESSLQRKGAQSGKVMEFKTFMEKIRESGETASTDEILKYSKLFQDEITLDTLQHNHLVALCKLLEVQTIGTTAFLRFQLRMKMRTLEADDKMIRKEGIETLTVWELQEACRARGMRALGVSVQRMKLQLQQWLDLHLEHRVPTSLLLLSRALYLPEQLSPEQQLQATISSLPETAAEEAKVKISEVSGERVDHEAKLKVISQEEEAIRKEKAEIRAEEERKRKEEEEELRRKEEAAAAAEAPTTAEQLQLDQERLEPVGKTPDMSEPKPEEILIDKAPVIAETPDEVIVEKIEEISTKDLEELEEVLEKVAEERLDKKVESEELKELKEDVESYQYNLNQIKEVVESGSTKEEIKESKAATRLSKRVNNMVQQLHDHIEKLHDQKATLQEDIEVGEVRIKHKKSEDEKQELLDRIEDKKRNLITINELVLAMKRIQKISDDTKIQRIWEYLDEDHDGAVDINDALKVIELIGEENVKIKSDQMTEILSLLKKETAISEEEKLQKEAEHPATLAEHSAKLSEQSAKGEIKQ